jgi:hypothetical protein
MKTQPFGETNVFANSNFLLFPLNFFTESRAEKTKNKFQNEQSFIRLTFFQNNRFLKNLRFFFAGGSISSSSDVPISLNFPSKSEIEKIKLQKNIFKKHHQSKTKTYLNVSPPPVLVRFVSRSNFFQHFQTFLKKEKTMTLEHRFIFS